MMLSVVQKHCSRPEARLRRSGKTDALQLFGGARPAAHAPLVRSHSQAYRSGCDTGPGDHNDREGVGYRFEPHTRRCKRTGKGASRELKGMTNRKIAGRRIDEAEHFRNTWKSPPITISQGIVARLSIELVSLRLPIPDQPCLAVEDRIT